jgi:spermidine synthase
MSIVVGAVVFLAAALLFLIQPVLAKLLLPTFGGAGGVWAVCLFFFQTLLLAGYAYAHALIRFVPPKKQAWVHTILLGASLLALPIALPVAQRLPENPMAAIVGLLATAVGAPYLMLASTSPLLQAWLARDGFGTGGRVPYRLFAVSNLASLGGLLAYPVLIEPRSTAATQTAAWSIAYFIFAALVAAVAWRAAGTYSPAPARETESGAPTAREYLKWLLLAALPSALLVAITNHITQNVASLPFLWILPLSIYLLTFILAFDRESTAHWSGWSWFAGIALMVACTGQILTEAEAKWMIPLFGGALFFIAMYFHSKLVTLKPDASSLTAFYLTISLGGALGSLLVSLVAPVVFTGFHELPLLLVGSALALLFFEYGGHWARRLRWGTVLLATVLTARVWFEAVALHSIANGRNFYGVLKVEEKELTKEQGPARILIHGTIKHGAQLLTEGRRLEAITYYSPESGAGLALGARPHPNWAVIGLGTGSLAALANPGDHLRYYEINALDVDYARRYFTFLARSAATVDIALGDARLKLQAEPPSQPYDLLAVDAFSGDAIPVHLLTRECFELYRQHLAPGGLLVVHVSNTHLDLPPVVASSARAIGFEPRVVAYDPPAGSPYYASTWVIAARPETWQTLPQLRKASVALNPARDVLWTDNYSTLLGLLR